ncbi:MAG: SH3 domain-containing protein [Spirochaetales bacterium]|nr:SH3 domain-containing protein [Spirochaetales bacterium]
MAGLCLALFAFVLTSCGPGRIGYGVLLWSEDEAALPTGSVLPVYEESRLRQAYVTGGSEPDREKERHEVAIWRVQFFPDKKDAQAFAGGFEGVKDLYVRANRNALPIREKADRLSRQVYRLRQNETMKILALGVTPSDENGLQGYWYHVLTEEGVSGFCFNYHLILFNAKTNAIISTSQDASQEAVAAILTNSWKPDFFREMVSSGRIDLVRFRSDYGLFFDEEPRQLRIVLPSVSFSVPFSRIRKATGDTYIAEGSDVQMQLRADQTELVVSYPHNAGRRTSAFSAFKEDVEEIIIREQERRRNTLLAFVRNGSDLRSSAYGEIRITEEGDFTWTDFGRLVPSVIPAGTQNQGKVEFSVFTSGEAQNAYAGVITFRFAGTNRAVSFFYRFTEQGTQLIHIPPESIEENIVRRRPMNPLVLFFAPF